MKTRRLLACGRLLLGLVLAEFGCKSVQNHPTTSFAYVEIRGKTPLEIARTISEVFQEANYVPARLPANHKMTLMFEKEGNTGDMIMYGDWSSKKPWYRAKLNIKELDPETQLVECDAYRVSEHGDPRFEEETKLSHSKKGFYQDLLNRVKEKLTGTPTT